MAIPGGYGLGLISTCCLPRDGYWLSIKMFALPGRVPPGRVLALLWRGAEQAVLVLLIITPGGQYTMLDMHLPDPHLPQTRNKPEGISCFPGRLDPPRMRLPVSLPRIRPIHLRAW